jgi:hypothetical protein
VRGWEIGEEVTTLRCECPSWAHEACLAKSVFETGGCPTCRKSILLIDDEIVLSQAAQMEMQRSSDGYWRTGSSILYKAFSIRRPYCKLRMASGRPYPFGDSTFNESSLTGVIHVEFKRAKLILYQRRSLEGGLREIDHACQFYAVLFLKGWMNRRRIGRVIIKK